MIVMIVLCKVLQKWSQQIRLQICCQNQTPPRDLKRPKTKTAKQLSVLFQKAHNTYYSMWLIRRVSERSRPHRLLLKQESCMFQDDLIPGASPHHFPERPVTSQSIAFLRGILLLGILSDVLTPTNHIVKKIIKKDIMWQGDLSHHASSDKLKSIIPCLLCKLRVQVWNDRLHFWGRSTLKSHINK